jgi:mono/diheme cytochrome c family protein
MATKLTLLVVSTMILVTTAVSACGGATPAPTAAPTTKPAAPAAATAPAVAPTTAPTTAPTKAPAAATGAAPLAPATVAATAAAAPAAAGNATAGKAVFDQNCGSCHPNGAAGVGPALAGKNLAAATITTTVRSGRESMPPFPASKISDPQLADLVAYVQSLK